MPGYPYDIAVRPGDPIGGQGKGKPAGSVGTVPVAPPEQPVGPAPAPPGQQPNIKAGFGPQTFGSLDTFKSYQRGRMARLLGGKLPINY